MLQPAAELVQLIAKPRALISIRSQGNYDAKHAGSSPRLPSRRKTLHESEKFMLSKVCGFAASDAVPHANSTLLCSQHEAEHF
jgi:hypothetical protein